MKLTTFIAALLLIALPLTHPSPAAAQDTETLRYTFADEGSEMILEGSSNVGRSWDAQATEFGGSAQVTIGEGTLAFEQVTFQVFTGGILSDRGTVEDKIHEALRREAYSFIFFRVDDVEVEGPMSEEFAIEASGEMIVAGGRKNITVNVTGTMNGENLRVQGEKQFHMRDDFGIDPPTAMLGAVRAAPELLVRFDVLLTPDS